MIRHKPGDFNKAVRSGCQHSVIFYAASFKVYFVRKAD